MTPDWPVLWKRAPGTKPDCIVFNAEEVGPILPTVFAAVACRDAALLWRVNQGEVCLSLDQHGYEVIDTDNPFPRSGWPTLDEAVYAECMKFLDARDARSPSVQETG